MKNLFATTTLACLCMSTAFSQTQSLYPTRQLSSTANDNWSFDFSSGASFGINSSEATLFRGNSLATKLSGRYAFGAFGLGLSGGLVPGSISESAVNSFLTERKINPEQSQVNTGKPSNGYLLFGPSVRFGKRVTLLAEVQGGMFMNDPGSMSVTQNGIQRPVYGFSGGSEKYAPGFSGTIQIAYPLNKSSRFFINTDYFSSNSSIRIIDQQAGIDVPTEQKRDTRLFTASLGFTKTFGASSSTNNRRQVSNTTNNAGMATAEEIASMPAQQAYAREAGSGLATGRRILPETGSGIIAARDAGSGMATGRRIYQPGQPVYGNLNSREACGSVTQRTTYPDGTTEENTFACPGDAAEYNRISMNVTVPKQTQGATFGEKVNQGLHAAGSSLNKNVTVPKQTQGATFGEKVNQGLHAAGSALGQGASLTTSEDIIHNDIAARNTISGRLTWNSGENNPAYAIVTNTSTTRGGSATLNSQTSATRTTPQSSFGTMTRNGFTANIYTRDAASGRPTGRRSRDAGSGMATGRRQYSPVFSEDGSTTCSTCDVAVVSNPLYEQTGNSGENPLFEASAKSGTNPYYAGNELSGENPTLQNQNPGNNTEDAEGVAGIKVYLLNPENNAVIAKTKTEANGDFWFAHVPEGNYVVKVSGSVMSKKQYDITINKGAKDVAGELLSAADSWTLQFSVEPDSAAEVARVIKSKSNVKNNRTASSTKRGYQYYKSLSATINDEDGDGRSESLVGSVMPGAGVISSAFTAVGPIKGVIVKGGRNPGSEASRTSVTNEYGEFEFTNMEPGAYFIRTEHLTVIDDETLINTATDGPQQRAQDHNSTRSNKTSYAVNNGDAQQKAQDHNSTRSNKTASVANMGKDGSPDSRAQDHNSSRSNKTNTIANPDQDGTPDLRAQNNNTVRSNRGELKSVLIEADTDGDGEFETDITNAYAYSLLTDEKGNYGDAQQKAGISTSRSNIRNKSSLQDIGNDLYIVYGSTTINGKTVETKSVLKTKHDTAKNSVGNIR